jgi:hypothetical protein
MNYDPHFREVSRYEPRFLNRGNFPAYRGSVTIEKGQVLKKGSVLGRKAASGKHVLCSKTAEDGTTAISDGSEKARCILQIDIDATAGDRFAPVFRTGAFLRLDLTVGKGHTLESVEDDLETHNIYLENGED